MQREKRGSKRGGEGRGEGGGIHFPCGEISAISSSTVMFSSPFDFITSV